MPTAAHQKPEPDALFQSPALPFVMSLVEQNLSGADLNAEP